MFSLCDLRFVVWSLFLDVLRAQRIIVFFLNFPLINEVGKSNHMVGKTVLRSAFSLFFSRYSWSLILWRSIDYFIGAIMERWRIFHVLFRASLVRCHWFTRYWQRNLYTLPIGYYLHCVQFGWPRLSAWTILLQRSLSSSIQFFAAWKFSALWETLVWIRVHCFVILVNVKNP